MVLPSMPDLGVKVPFSVNNKLLNPPGPMKLNYRTSLACLEGLWGTCRPWCGGSPSQPSFQLHFNSDPQPSKVVEQQAGNYNCPRVWWDIQP